MTAEKMFMMEEGRRNDQRHRAEKVEAERDELLCERDEARVDRDILKAECDAGKKALIDSCNDEIAELQAELKAERQVTTDYVIGYAKLEAELEELLQRCAKLYNRDSDNLARLAAKEQAK